MIIKQKKLNNGVQIRLTEKKNTDRIYKFILFTKREGRTGRISAGGLDSTDRA